MSKTIYLEGGGDSKELHARCREGFRKLLERCGFKGRMPHLVACGGRGATFDDFKTAHALKQLPDYVAMLIDSEDSPSDPDNPWHHLIARDEWDKPEGAVDDQVLFMVTCMETWIVASRDVLILHYGTTLQESALPALTNLEARSRQSVQENLAHATRNCSNAYQKGKRSFEILGKLDPTVLAHYLGSFERMRRILDEKL